MKKKIKIATIALFVILFGFVSFILNETKDEVNANFDTIDEILTKLQKNDKNAGFAVSVFCRDSVLFQKGFGYSDIENKTPYTVKTQQYIASISKTTIGISLLKAQEMNLLSLDDDINKFLPFSVRNPKFPNEDITIRHLATHTSSLDYNEKVVESLYISDNDKNPLLHDFVTGYFKAKRFGEVAFTDKKPGTHFNYSNIGAGLAAYIIERTTGMSFVDFTKNHIFKPLEMKVASWFVNDSIKQSFQTKYYEPRNNSLSKVTAKGVILYPARDLSTNIIDLTKYCQAVIAKSPKLLKEESFQELLMPQLDGDVKINAIDNTGLFWMIDRNQYGVTYQLTGMNGGDNCINTMLWFDPKTELGYIFMGNTGQAEQNRVSHIWIFRSLVSLGDYYFLNKANGLSEKIAYKWHNVYSRINGLF